VLALRVGICFGRGNWESVQALTRKLITLEPFNHKWSFAYGFATAKIDSKMGKED
jgi:hypothetical protein